MSNFFWQNLRLPHQKNVKHETKFGNITYQRWCNTFTVYDNAHSVEGTMARSLSQEPPLPWSLQIDCTVFTKAILVPFIRFLCQKSSCLITSCQIITPKNPPALHIEYIKPSICTGKIQLADPKHLKKKDLKGLSNDIRYVPSRCCSSKKLLCPLYWTWSYEVCCLVRPVMRITATSSFQTPDNLPKVLSLKFGPTQNKPYRFSFNVAWSLPLWY